MLGRKKVGYLGLRYGAGGRESLSKADTISSSLAKTCEPCGIDFDREIPAS